MKEVKLDTSWVGILFAAFWVPAGLSIAYQAIPKDETFHYFLQAPALGLAFGLLVLAFRDSHLLPLYM